MTERLHIFGPENVFGSFGQLIKPRGTDPDDDPSQLQTADEHPQNGRNLMRGMPVKGMTPPAAPVPVGAREILAINDGFYGNDSGWSDGWFQVKLKEKARVGRFKFGRDRTGRMSDRCADYLRIEASIDGQQWQTVFEQDHLTKVPGFSPAKTVEILIVPVEAQYLKVTLMPPGANGKGPLPVLDEFEAYAPAANAPAQLPQVAVLEQTDLSRPLRHTILEVAAGPVRVEGDQEVLELNVRNAGPMTAFPCEAHPLISYRTNLFIDNNHCFVPPGESRTITIRASKTPACGLSLTQTGWWISCWNAERVMVAASEDVLLTVGRRDQMCREFLGYFDPGKIVNVKQTTLVGTHPDPSPLPYLLGHGKLVRFEFPVSGTQAKRPAWLRIHTADQSKDARAVVDVTLNGTRFEQPLPEGLGIQKADPAHLAFPAKVEFAISSGILQEGKNVLDVQVKNDGWFTWDSLECLVAKQVEE